MITGLIIYQELTKSLSRCCFSTNNTAMDSVFRQLPSYYKSLYAGVNGRHFGSC